jgi:hypothetical protein
MVYDRILKLGIREPASRQLHREKYFTQRRKAAKEEEMIGESPAWGTMRSSPSSDPFLGAFAPLREILLPKAPAITLVVVAVVAEEFA